ncbi:TBC1 domain, member 5 [Tritrichomonas musculus]|uniref:TBC1 domain, member 5 n=1 Tax=Tritrichomonas musculus TaxID=1915356 RepID=A0ABR2H565_9EUKA
MSCKQEKHFLSVFPNGTFFKPALDEIIFSEKIENFKIKSAIWKFYLTVFPRISSPSANVSEWSNIIKRSRSIYKKIRNHFIINPDCIKDKEHLGPLSQENPKWNQYFEDEKKMNQIITDTNRLYQEIDFFQNKENIKHINEIIFLHLRRFKLEYKQGYHELCGVAYYVYKNEMKSTYEDYKSDIDNNYGYNFLFSHKDDDIDADVFWTYSTLIEYVKPFYQVSDDIKRPPYCVQISKYILDGLLKKYDLELSSKVKVGDSFTSIIPWTRLFFTRQYDLCDIPSLWTNIFTFFPDIDIICYISISILIVYREKLLACPNETAVLISMMNIHVDHPKEVTSKALHLYRENKSPSKGQKKISCLCEAMCCEIQKVINNIQAVPKSNLISELKKFRDSLNLIVKSDQNVELVMNSDVEMLGSLPVSPPDISNDQEYKDEKVEDADILIDLSNLSLIPQYTNGSDNEYNNDDVNDK